MIVRGLSTARRDVELVWLGPMTTPLNTALAIHIYNRKEAQTRPYTYVS
jgi:hypothetical protein